MLWGKDAASFQPDPYLHTAAPPFSISPNLAVFPDSEECLLLTPSLTPSREALSL